MTEQQLQQLRDDVYQWCFFFLHDRDFLKAMRSKYTAEDVDREVATLIALIKTWVKPF